MPDTRKSALLRLKTTAERLTRTDLSYLLHGGVWLAIGQVALSAMAFGTSIAFAHFVSKEDYGTYRFLLSIFWSLTAFGLSGIPTALSRAVARKENGAYWQALRLSLIGSIPVALVAIGLALYYYLNTNPVLALGCLVIAVIGPFMQAAYLYGAFLEGKGAFKQNALQGIVLNLIPTLGLLVLMIYLQDPIAFLVMYLAGSVLVGSCISVYTLSRFRIDAHSKRSDEFKSLGIHMSVMNVLSTLSQQADKLLVFHELGPIELAIYSFAVSMPDQLRALIGNIEVLAFPKFAQRSIEEVMPTLGRRLFGFTALVTVGVVGYIVIAPYVFQYLFPTYMESAFFSQLYALSLIPIASIVPTSLLQAHAAKRELYIFNTTTPIVQIGLLWIGISMFGLMGAILARIAGRVFSLVISLILVQLYAKRTKTP